MYVNETMNTYYYMIKYVIMSNKYHNTITCFQLHIWDLKDLSEFLQQAHLKQLLCDICEDIIQHIIRKLIQLFECHITKYTIIMTYIIFRSHIYNIMLIDLVLELFFLLNHVVMHLFRMVLP